MVALKEHRELAIQAGRSGRVENLGALALTHSSRVTNLDRCSAEFLVKRFGNPSRLNDLPPFESLRPAETLYSGSVSFYRVMRDESGCLMFDSIGSFKDKDKIQHAILIDQKRILMGYEHRVECWELSRSIFSPTRVVKSACSMQSRFEHPHLAGLHTIEIVSTGRVLLSCAGSDSVLECDLKHGLLERTLRMPESLYGRNYTLTPEMDLRLHYIHDGCQTTHINAASVDGNGRLAVVSTLIQGAIGLFDLNTGAYEEIARGFVGCHGARFNDRGEIYLADSPRGILVFLGRNGSVTRRYQTDSLWLHDVQQIYGSIYAFSMADTNELRIYDIDSQEALFRKRFSTVPFEDSSSVAEAPPDWLGNSTQALSYFAFR
jgi:hypothetical protein